MMRTGTGTVVSFDRAFEGIEQLASSAKTLSENLSAKSLADTLTGRDVSRYFGDLGNVRDQLQGWAAKFTDTAAATAFAQDRYNDPTYDPIAEYQAVLAAINGVLNYIAANIPTDLLTWDAAGGQVSWNNYSAAATAGLRSELQTLIFAID